MEINEVTVTVNLSDNTEFDDEYMVYEDDYNELISRLKEENPDMTSLVLVVSF